MQVRLDAFPRDLNDLEAKNTRACWHTHLNCLSVVWQGVDDDLRILDNIFDGAQVAQLSARVLTATTVRYIFGHFCFAYGSIQYHTVDGFGFFLQTTHDMKLGWRCN